MRLIFPAILLIFLIHQSKCAKRRDVKQLFAQHELKKKEIEWTKLNIASGKSKRDHVTSMSKSIGGSGTSYKEMDRVLGLDENSRMEMVVSMKSAQGTKIVRTREIVSGS